MSLSTSLLTSSLGPPESQALSPGPVRMAAIPSGCPGVTPSVPVGLIKQRWQVQGSLFTAYGTGSWVAGARGGQGEVYLLAELGVLAASEALGFPLIIICRSWAPRARLSSDR